MNPVILPPAMGKYYGRLRSSALVRQPVKEKENSEFKPAKLRLKNLPRVISCPRGGVGRYDNCTYLNTEAEEPIQLGL